MLTNEEKIIFNEFRKVAISEGYKQLEYQITMNDPNNNSELDVYVDSDFFEYYESGYYSSNKEIIDIKYREALFKWFEREVLPKIEDTYNSLVNLIDSDYISYGYITLNFDCVEKQIFSKMYLSFEAEGDTETVTWEYGDDSDVDTILDTRPEFPENVTQIKVYYYGGGDSGQIDEFVDNTGKTYSDSENPIYRYEDFFYQQLPGGWEINEGSRGNYVVDFSEKTITLEHTNNYEDSEVEFIVSDKF